MDALNWFAIFAAALSAFLLGGIWYGPLFKHAWCREAGVDPQAPRKRHPAGVFGLAFVASLIAAIGFAWHVGPAPGVFNAIHAGVFIGLFWIATSFAINYSFAGRSFKLWAIDAGYHLLQFALYGLILGLWH